MNPLGRPQHFTIHIRLTRGCNAHCTYCSSAGGPDDRMTPDRFGAAIDWIVEAVLPRIGVGRNHFLTVEYLGGEVLLVPQADLEACVAHARRAFGAAVRTVRDGVQTNLIGAPRRVEALADLFDGRLGTSWDRRSGQRTIRGDATLYNAILDRSLAHLERARGLRPGRVLVVDSQTVGHLAEEVEEAAAGGYDLVLRPAFQGGSDAVAFATLDRLIEGYTKAYATWRRTRTADGPRVEPFSTLWERRAFERTGRAPVGGCPFQSDCAFRSLSLDPDGALYICQEMADAGHFPLGNAVERRFDETTWRRLARRTAHLDTTCKRCPWLHSCGGGCMNEAVQRFGDPFAKTELCSVWTALFSAIDHDQQEDTR